MIFLIEKVLVPVPIIQLFKTIVKTFSPINIFIKNFKIIYTISCIYIPSFHFTRHIIYFTINFTDTDKETTHPIVNINKTIFIWLTFILYTKMTIVPTIIVLMLPMKFLRCTHPPCKGLPRPLLAAISWGSSWSAACR